MNPVLTASSYVVLEAGFGAADPFGQPKVFLNQNKPDGSSGPFKLQPNQALVITEVDWQFFGLFDDNQKPILTETQSVRFFLWGQPGPSDPGTPPPQPQKSLVLSFPIDLGSSGMAQGNVVMNTGFLMTGPESLTFDMVSAPLAASDKLGFMLRGYLVAA